MTPETLKRIKWAGCDRDGNGYCVVCGEPASSDEHAPDCQLKANLDASSGERPEIQVGDDITIDGFPESHHVGHAGLAGLWNGDAKRIDSVKRVIWRRGGATA